MKLKIFFLLLIVFGGIFVAASSDEESKAKSVVIKTAQDLGWPTSIGPREGAPGKSYQVTLEGGDAEEPEQFAAIVITDSEIEALGMLQLFQDNGMRRSTFHGRDAIITYPTDKICKAKENSIMDLALKIVRFFAKQIAESMGIDNYNASQLCINPHENYAWKCGKYVFIVQDQTMDGYGETIANSLYARANEANICGMESTVVLLSAPSDISGTKELSHFQKIAQGVNTYYSYNGYGRTSFTYTFFDADGSEGSNDWFVMEEPIASYNWESYVLSSIKNAFEKQYLPKEVYLDRIVVVHPGNGKQLGGPANLYSACWWMDNNFNIEVTDVEGNECKVYVQNIILQSENDDVGTWAHEFGHTLYSKNKVDKFNRISDRYNYDGEPWGQYGRIDEFGLMGSGNWWGNPAGTSPTHMSSFTKESANWLSYKDITKLNQTYTISSLENLKFGGDVYRLDEPRTDNPNFYYIIEARDNSVPFGYPESGVVIYSVQYDSVNKHHIVNLLSPQTGTFFDYSNGNSYMRPTLNSVSGDGSMFIHVPAKFYVKLESQSNSPYTANVYVGEYKPVDLKGVIINMKNMFKNTAKGLFNFPAYPLNGEDLPDLDLHAYDEYGNHVGLNYQTNEYENQIPGAISSGDLKDSEEWIFVPENVNVNYVISNERINKFIQANPEYAKEFKEVKPKISYMKFDKQGNAQITDEKEITITKNNHNIDSPDSTKLKYKSYKYSGFNNNEGSVFCCPMFILIGLLTLGLYIKYKN